MYEIVIVITIVFNKRSVKIKNNRLWCGRERL